MTHVATLFFPRCYVLRNVIPPQGGATGPDRPPPRSLEDLSGRIIERVCLLHIPRMIQGVYG